MGERIGSRRAGPSAPATPPVPTALPRPSVLLRYVLAASSLVPALLVAVTGLLASPADARGGAPAMPQELREVVVRVGGARIRALCTEGAPEVLLLHGDSATADSWRPVLERLDGLVGACAYDRRGSGESRPAPGERGWYELLDELRRIHEALGAEPPYALVGDGVGGLYARLYAADRSPDVAGLVLVEPAHADLARRMRPGMPDDAWSAWEARRGRPNADGVVERTVAERAERVRLPRIPVTALTATVRRDGGGWDARFLNEAARQVHASILRGVTLGRHVPAEGSGVAIVRDDPRLVASEIVRVVNAGQPLGRGGVGRKRGR